jgi:hypothetical protein
MIYISSKDDCGEEDFRYLQTEEARIPGEIQGIIQDKK